ncbi:MAG: TolB family protein [Fimbriimonadaceae bacterium]
MKPDATAKQPKMQQRIALRLAIGLLGVAALLFAWYFIKQFVASNADWGHTDTSGWILALRQTSNGEQAVVLKPDDTMLESPGYKDGVIDRDPTWQPDGDRIYFTSDRDATTKSLQIYRWNPAKGSVDQRSSGKLAQEKPIFQEDGSTGGNYTMLVIKAGVVVEFNPNDGSAHQRVPVEGKTPTQAGGDAGQGMGTQFGPEYAHLGTSFREAHWSKSGKYIAGIMRSDDGDTLVVICMNPGSTPGGLDDGLPHGIVKGEHIDMAIDPATGNIVYTVDNFQFIDPTQVPASMIKDGKAVKPFRNMLGMLNPDAPAKSGAIVLWRNGEHAFAEPQVSPDGSQVAFVIGMDTNNGFKPLGIAVAPLALGGGKSTKPLVGGDVASPCWSPDGSKIGFVVVTPDGHSDIDVMPATGGAPKIITAGEGSFSSPHFSPMKPKAGS